MPKFVIVTPLGIIFLKLILWPLKSIGILSINLLENALAEAKDPELLRSADSSNTAMGTPSENVSGSSHSRGPGLELKKTVNCMPGGSTYTLRSGSGSIGMLIGHGMSLVMRSVK